MRRAIFVLILLTTIGLCLPLMASEKITGFHIERDIFGEQNWYLQDKEGNREYGYFNCTTESSYIGYNTILTTYYIKDRSEEPYYGRVEPQKFGEMVIANSRFRKNMFWTIFSGSFTTAFIVPGAVLMGVGYPYIDVDNPLYGTGSEAIFYSGVACTVFAVTMAISFLVFMPMMLFYLFKYRKMRTRILDILNGTIRAGERGPRVRLALDLRWQN